MSTREYEAMFLLDNAAATADFEAAAAQVDTILEKHGGTIVQREKWDERRLAYEIKGHRRATYYLIYFQAPPESLVEMDQDIGLNEVILRHLTIALEEPIADHIKHRDEDREKMAEESRRSSLSGWGDRKQRGGDRGRRDRQSDDEAPAAAEGAPAAAATPAPAAEAPAAEAATAAATSNESADAKQES